jgi:hypothetical protein
VIPRATSKQNCCSAALSFSGERLAHCWRTKKSSDRMAVSMVSPTAEAVAIVS